jgi:hypothetical protein
MGDALPPVLRKPLAVPDAVAMICLHIIIEPESQFVVTSLAWMHYGRLTLRHACFKLTSSLQVVRAEKARLKNLRTTVLKYDILDKSTINISPGDKDD